MKTLDDNGITDGKRVDFLQQLSWTVPEKSPSLVRTIRAREGSRLVAVPEVYSHDSAILQIKNKGRELHNRGFCSEVSALFTLADNLDA